MWIATETLNPKPLSTISGHFREQKTTLLTVLVPKISIVGFGGTTSGNGDLLCREFAITARWRRSCQLFQISAVTPLSQFISLQQRCSPSLQNLLADSNPSVQNSGRCVESAATSCARMQRQKLEEWSRTICISKTKWRGTRKVILIMIIQSGPLPLDSIQCLAMIAALLTPTN
jgi:hypothetical protein